MIDHTAMEFFGDNPEPCLAGTLCLMSLYRDNPCAVIAHKIIHNLYVLGHQSAFSEPFRVVLRELYEDWSRRLGVNRDMLNFNPETATSH
jgi:hypothetical protein